MANSNDLLYRQDIYNAIYNVIMGHLADKQIPSDLIHDILKTINEAQSTYWHPCDDNNNVPPKDEEVLVSLEYPNGKKEVAFSSHCGDNRNASLAFWGGYNGLVKAWGEVPTSYDGEKSDE